MTAINVDTLHQVTNKSDAQEEAYIELQIQEEVDSGILSGTTTKLNIINVSDFYQLSATTSTYVRCTGGTYTIVLPPALGTGGELHIKNIGSGTITVTPDGTDTLDWIGTKDITTGAALYIIDGVAGNWEIN